MGLAASRSQRSGLIAGDAAELRVDVTHSGGAQSGHLSLKLTHPRT